MSTEPHALKVNRETDPGKLGKSIAMTLHEQDGKTKVRAMGPQAVNQAVKGIIIARQLLAAQAKDIEIIPAFDTREEQGAEVTVIVFNLTLLEQ